MTQKKSKIIQFTRRRAIEYQLFCAACDSPNIIVILHSENPLDFKQMICSDCNSVVIDDIRMKGE